MKKQINNLIEELKAKGERISKAERVKSLLQKQKGFLKTKQSLTDFQEPVLFLTRRDGKMDIYEKATAGKFVYTHSTGRLQYLELRPSDQVTFDYGDRKVRAYNAHEDRPYAGWDNPIVDGESTMLAYEKTKATDLKYQQKMEELKNAGKLTWLWIIGGIILAIALALTIIPDSVWERLSNKGTEEVSKVVAPTVGCLLLKIKNKKNSNN